MLAALKDFWRKLQNTSRILEDPAVGPTIRNHGEWKPKFKQLRQTSTAVSANILFYIPFLAYLCSGTHSFATEGLRSWDIGSAAIIGLTCASFIHFFFSLYEIVDQVSDARVRRHYNNISDRITGELAEKTEEYGLQAVERYVHAVYSHVGTLDGVRTDDIGLDMFSIYAILIHQYGFSSGILSDHYSASLTEFADLGDMFTSQTSVAEQET